jgi:hypothetical protein
MLYTYTVSLINEQCQKSLAYVLILRQHVRTSLREGILFLSAFLLVVKDHLKI